MPHVSLPDALPGVSSGFAFRPETARPIRELAEILLRAANTLSSGEREMIATYVSTLSNCSFCRMSHRAAAAHHQGPATSCWIPFVATVRLRPLVPNSKPLLQIAGAV